MLRLLRLRRPTTCQNERRCEMHSVCAFPAPSPHLQDDTRTSLPTRPRTHISAALSFLRRTREDALGECDERRRQHEGAKTQRELARKEGKHAMERRV
eukprot:2659292-Rhodomonas_salina.3